MHNQVPASKDFTVLAEVLLGFSKGEVIQQEQIKENQLSEGIPGCPAELNTHGMGEGF